MTLHGLLGYLVFNNILPAIFNDYNYTGTSLNGIRPPLIVWIQFIGITVWENCYWQRLLLFEFLLFPFPSRMSFVEFCSDQAPQFRSQAHCRCFSRKHKAGRSGCDMFYIWSLEAYCSLLSFPVWGRPQTRHSFFDILFCLYLDFQACVGYEIKHVSLFPHIHEGDWHHEPSLISMCCGFIWDIHAWLFTYLERVDTYSVFVVSFAVQHVTWLWIFSIYALLQSSCLSNRLSAMVCRLISTGREKGAQ